MNQNKSASEKQEKRIAKRFSGSRPPNSGGGRFIKGDILLPNLFIEAKTNATNKKSITVKRDWIDKAREQAFSMGKDYFAIAINFNPDGDTHYIVSEEMMKLLIEKLETEA